jgi:hypothetical protein
MKTNEISQYDQQATDFLTKYGIKFRATLSNSKTTPWNEDGEDRNHYRITLSRPARLGKVEGASLPMLMPSARLVFDFWGSIADARENKHPSAYDVLACISSDAYTPETFADFCAEYGYESGSIKALQKFRRCSTFAKRLRAFFTESELSDLAEIQ